MASLKDTDQLAQQLEELAGQLRSELTNGNVDFEKLVSIADQLSEQADGLAETFTNVNDALMERLDQVKSGSGRSRGASRQSQSESKSESKTSTARS